MTPVPQRQRPIPTSFRRGWLALALAGSTACSPAALSIGVEDGEDQESDSLGSGSTEDGSDTGSGTDDAADPCWQLTEPPCELIDSDLSCVEVNAHELVLHNDSGYCVEPSVFIGCISALTDCAEEISYWCDDEHIYETAWDCQPPGVESCSAPEPIVGPCP